MTLKKNFLNIQFEWKETEKNKNPNKTEKADWKKEFKKDFIAACLLCPDHWSIINLISLGFAT